MSSFQSAASDDELVIAKDSNQDELNELLGGSDDEGSNHDNGNELNDLLGNSDDDSEQDNNANDRSNEPSNGQEESRSNELDQILGKVDVKLSFKDNRTKTKSKVVLPGTYKVPANNLSVFVRTPNFIKIQTDIYDEFLYSDKAERELFNGSTAVVRWRNKVDENGQTVLDSAGRPIKESNARMIQWSDGSVQLVVGDAVFQCKNVDVDNCYVYESRNVDVVSTANAEQEPAKTNDTCLECVGSIHHRLVLQPTSLDSESHARMSLKISEKHKKESKIQSRDYEQITEKPEKTLANLARIEEEQMRKDRKLKERQGVYNTGNTITGNARSFRRPAMNADYLASGGYDDEEGDVEEQAFERLDRERAAQKPHPKSAGAPKPKAAPKKKGPVSNDYLEYDDEDGSEMEDEDEDEDEDNSEMEDDEDDEDAEDVEEEERSEDSEEGSDEGGDSDGSARKKSSSKKSKADKKESKADRKARKAEKRARRKEKQDKREKRRADKEDRPKAQKRPVEERVEAARSAPAAEREAAVSGEEDDEEVAVQQRKRIKRAILDSDDDE